MRLCLRLGRFNVDQFLRTISYRQLCEWIAFYNLEPFGDEWRQTGMVCATTGNVYSSGSNPLDPEDFMPIRKEIKQLTAQETVIVLDSMFGSRIKRRSAT